MHIFVLTVICILNLENKVAEYLVAYTHIHTSEKWSVLDTNLSGIA